MAEIIYPFGASFDPETNHAMGLALEMAWKKANKSGLHLAGRLPGPAREVLALRILELARHGERDPAVLCDKALERAQASRRPDAKGVV